MKKFIIKFFDIKIKTKSIEEFIEIVKREGSTEVKIQTDGSETILPSPNYWKYELSFSATTSQGQGIIYSKVLCVKHENYDGLSGAIKKYNSEIKLLQAAQQARIDLQAKLPGVSVNFVDWNGSSLDNVEYSLIEELEQQKGRKLVTI